MEILDLTALQLKQKGFKQNVNAQSVTYRKNTINGYFYFNPLEEKYRWYHVTIIGDASNHVHLNIEDEDQLSMVLKSFNCL